MKKFNLIASDVFTSNYSMRFYEVFNVEGKLRPYILVRIYLHDTFMGQFYSSPARWPTVAQKMIEGWNRTGA